MNLPLSKWLALTLATMLMVVGCAVSSPSSEPVADPADQMAELHSGDSPVASAAVGDVPDGSVSTESVVYTTLGDPPITGYLAKPADATGPLPGLIVIQEWWGLNDNIRAMTRRLAHEGYVALAVDLYGGEVADTPDQARALVQAALQAPEQLTQNLVAAYEYLENEQQAPAIGSIGWCFGGTWSLNTALALPTELDAAVIYYGGQIATDPGVLEPLQMPIQGHFGELDSNPSPETVAAFEAALDGLGKAADVYLYEGANHAFANPSGTRYNAAAAELAWERTVEFFGEHL
ncbi:MAG: dienelactone hydrolase family protein [Cyanobacteria bacterium P01_A01_bin.105]